MPQLLKQTQKSRLQELLKAPKPPTFTEAAPTGQPHGPCRCGGTIFSVLPDGREVCWGCDYDRAKRPGVARAIGLVPSAASDLIAVDITSPEFATADYPQQWWLRRPEGTWRISAKPSDRVPSGVLIEEWFEPFVAKAAEAAEEQQDAM